MSRPPVELHLRRAMTLARKERIHAAHLGRCEECQKPLPVSGPEVAYDHVVALALGGPDTDDNLQLLCTVPCHARKTAADLTAIAKAKRLAGETGQDRRGRGINSRGFDTTLTRGFNGKVRPRQQKAHVNDR